MRIRAVAVSVGYVLSIVLANWLVTRYGLVPVGFGLVAPAGVYAAGLALALRDGTQDLAGRVAVIALILVGATLSWWLASGTIAFASGVAFLVSELADFGVYTPLRRKGLALAVFASNLVGAVLDTYVFLWLAHFGTSNRLVAGQLLGKFWATCAGFAVVYGLEWHKERRSVDAVPDAA